MSFDLNKILTPHGKAVEIILERRKNPELVKAVTEYLKGDVPRHFLYDKPTLYLSRHLATPNFEALHFVNLCQPFDLPIVIGQDIKGTFVTNNELKLPLGKLPIVKGFARNNDEIIENFTIIDVTRAQGKPLNEIYTLFGQSLPQFHTELFLSHYADIVELADESSWVDRNFRDNLKEQYKRMLALLIVHGVMFETYLPEEHEFIDEILMPTLNEIEALFGCKPLIAELVPLEREYERNWNSYPVTLYDFVRSKFNVEKV